MFWRLTNQDFNIRLVDVKNEKYNGLLAGVSFPPSSRAPCVSLAPKTSFPYPFKRLPRRLPVAIRTGPVHRLVFAIHTGFWLNWLGLSNENSD